jgi:hypothetical protein
MQALARCAAGLPHAARASPASSRISPPAPPTSARSIVPMPGAPLAPYAPRMSGHTRGQPPPGSACLRVRWTLIVGGRRVRVTVSAVATAGFARRWLALHRSTPRLLPSQAAQVGFCAWTSRTTASALTTIRANNTPGGASRELMAADPLFAARPPAPVRASTGADVARYVVKT